MSGKPRPRQQVRPGESASSPFCPVVKHVVVVVVAVVVVGDSHSS